MSLSAVTKIGHISQENGYFLTCAESCTGGWIAQTLTTISGSSAWFDRGFVTYSNTSKQQMLGVKKVSLEKYGAVSEPVIKEMAIGALKNSEAQISIAVSGIAGPGGGTIEKPIGTVWIAWAFDFNRDGVYRCETHCGHFAGDRQAVRQQTVDFSLQRLLSILTEH